MVKIEKIKKYLTEEGIVHRTSEQAEEELARAVGDEGKLSIDRLEEEYYQARRITSQALFDGLALEVPMAGVCVWDLRKSPQRTLYEHTLNYLGNYIQRRKPARVLEVGCGAGLESVFLAGINPNTRFIGMDISSRMIERAKKKAKEKALLNLDFVVGDMDKLPFAERSFDNILCLFSIDAGIHLPESYFGEYPDMTEYFDSITQRLKKLKTVVKADGRFILAGYHDPICINSMENRIDNVKEILESVGFRNHRTKKIDVEHDSERYMGFLVHSRND